MNILFDFDGTICDSLETTVEIINKVCKRFYLNPITSKDIRREGVLALLKEKNVPKAALPLILIYGRWVLRKRIQKLQSFKSLEQSIIHLSKKHKLGIITSNSSSNVQRFLVNNFKTDPFLFVHSELSFFNKDKKIKNVIDKYKLELDQTICVTDEQRDIFASHRLGIKCVAVTWGYESREVLERSKPDLIIDDPKELIGVHNKLGFS